MVKSLNEFYKAGTYKSGQPKYAGRCKSCWGSWNEDSRLRRTYGITLDEYEAMAASQGGVCAICRRPSQIARSLTVDHCHETGRVRGLLCHNCNLGIGHFRDCSEALTSAITYLKETQ